MTCAECSGTIPRYQGGVHAGFISPAAKGSAAEKAQVEFSQGPIGMTATAVERPVCAECYLRIFARVYPGAELPAMPQPA